LGKIERITGRQKNNQRGKPYKSSLNRCAKYPLP
jgi:hypothetical protein